MTDAPLIDSQGGLEELIRELAGKSIIAIDCEMDAMFAYRTSICLVQIGWGSGDALIDAMADLDWNALSPLFDAPEPVKIFHGGENDIGLMVSKWGLAFQGVYDTMAAAQVLGHERVGLASLLEEHFDVQLSKKFQKADWRVRPLPPEQAEYARLDVRYLIELRELQLAELVRLNRIDEAESEFRRIATACIDDRPFDPDGWVRIKGSRELEANRRGILREAFAARDEIARRLDRAPYRVMRESALLEIVRRRPTSLPQLMKIRGLNRDLGESELQLLVDAVERGRDASKVDLPSSRRSWMQHTASLSPAEQSLFDALRGWRAERAKRRGVTVARVATNVLLSAIARAAPRNAEQLLSVDGMEDWRLREYGEELLVVVSKHAEDGSGS